MYSFLLKYTWAYNPIENYLARTQRNLAENIFLNPTLLTKSKCNTRLPTFLAMIWQNSQIIIKEKKIHLNEFERDFFKMTGTVWTQAYVSFSTIMDLHLFREYLLASD